MDGNRFRDIMHGIFGMTDEVLMECMYQVFDMDQDGAVGPEEFVVGMSVFLRGTLEEKIDCDRELVEFLQEEIVAEKKSMSPGLPSHMDDFAVKGRDAELTLTKSFHDEQITITLNVNHTVDSEGPVEASQEADLRSKPSFEVDIKVGSKVMSFTCSYVNPGEALAEGNDQSEDVFGINELTIYEGEWGEDTYCVSGDILDGMMYDLLMNMLEERGVSNEFAEKLSSLCSDYEHYLYVNLLQNVQDFVKRK